MNNFDPMNSSGYYPAPQNSNAGWNQPRQYAGYPSQPRLNTNAIFVTSLEEALIKTTERNSDMYYFHQDKFEFYRVKVDMEGRKSWAIFHYNVPNQEDSTPATKADILALVARIEALEVSKEGKVAPKNKKKEMTENAESDG